jgi:hypothetical protein
MWVRLFFLLLPIFLVYGWLKIKKDYKFYNEVGKKMQFTSYLTGLVLSTFIIIFYFNDYIENLFFVFKAFFK